MRSFILTIIIGAMLLTTPSFVWAQREPLFISHNPVYEKIRVIEVLSTDTIRLENGEKVQLIGLKAPETPRHKKISRDQYGFVIDETEPFDTLQEQAFAFAQGLLLNEFVRLEFDDQKQGQYNTLLAYVYLQDSDLFVNEEILKQGFASLSLRPPNLKYKDQLRAAYQEARHERRGIQGQ